MLSCFCLKVFTFAQKYKRFCEKQTSDVTYVSFWEASKWCFAIISYFRSNDMIETVHELRIN